MKHTIVLVSIASILCLAGTASTSPRQQGYRNPWAWIDNGGGDSADASMHFHWESGYAYIPWGDYDYDCGGEGGNPSWYEGPSTTVFVAVTCGNGYFAGVLGNGTGFASCQIGEATGEEEYDCYDVDYMEVY